MATRSVADASTWKVVPLAVGTKVYSSTVPESVSLANPSILALPGGRIIVACDQNGPGVRDLPGSKGRNQNTNHFLQGRICVSADKGHKWTAKHEFPFCNPCLFNVGHRIYLLGHKGNVQIMRSDDGGETWSQPADLSSRDGTIVQGPASVAISDGCIYAAMMQYAGKSQRMTSAGHRSIVVMRAEEGVNLAAKNSWTFSEPGKPFCELITTDKLDYFGTPFFELPSSGRSRDLGGGRWANHPGWGHPHILKIADKDHVWHNAGAMHVLASAEMHRSNMAAIMRVNDCRDAMRLDLMPGAGGKKIVFMPIPGGNLKFSILYDEESALFWLASNQVTDSMIPPGKMPHERRGLPCDQRSRLALYFSRNLMDWCLAGFVDAGTNDRSSRHEPAMAIRGSDLYIACSAGGEHSRDSQHTDLITFHAIPAFRELAY